MAITCLASLSRSGRKMVGTVASLASLAAASRRCPAMRTTPASSSRPGGDDQGLQDAALLHRLRHLGHVAALAAEVPRMEPDGVKRSLLDDER
jgi:hypothetical protein